MGQSSLMRAPIKPHPTHPDNARRERTRGHNGAKSAPSAPPPHTAATNRTPAMITNATPYTASFSSVNNQTEYGGNPCSTTLLGILFYASCPPMEVHMHTNRKVVAMLTALTVLSGVAACSGTGDDSHGKEGAETIVVGMSSRTLPFAPIVVGDALDEFKQQGLNIEYSMVGPSDNLTLLATGEIDVMLTAPSAAFFNAVDGGAHVRMVAPFSPSPAADSGSKNGLWVSRELTGRHYEPSDLAGATIGSSAGPGALISVLIYQELQKAGLGLSDIKYQTLGTADILVALQSGSINAGWLSDPIWVDAVANKDLNAHRVIGWPAGVPQGGVFFGPNLLKNQPETGKAFLRAYYTTIKKHLSGNYYENNEVVNILANANDISVKKLKRVPPPPFENLLNGEFGSLLSPKTLQHVYSLKPGILQYDDFLTADDVYDTSLSEKALKKLGYASP